MHESTGAPRGTRATLGMRDVCDPLGTLSLMAAPRATQCPCPLPVLSPTLSGGCFSSFP